MPTLADIACAANCSTYTVSCALRGLRTVAPSTRERIVRIASEMDYRPDGAAALLALRRNRRRAGQALIPVAALGVPSWEVTSADGIWAGFRESCLFHGLDAKAWSPEDCATPRLSDILWSRGVKGLFLFQQGVARMRRAEWAPSAWARFHVVREGRIGRGLAFDLIRHSAFDFLMETMRQVLRKGYRRIGVVLETSLSAEDDLARVGAALAFQREELPEGGWVDLICFPAGKREMNARRAVDWLRQHRAEAAVVFPFGWRDELVRGGMEIPAELGLATLLRYETPCCNLAGCDAAGREMGSRAGELIFQLLRTGRSGLQSHPIEQVVEPIWVDGATLPGVPAVCSGAQARSTRKASSAQTMGTR